MTDGKLSCDVVIIGAGPSGSMAAKTCAKHGLDTVLIEREKDFREGTKPVLLHRRIFDYIKIDDRFLDAKIRGIRIISPDRTEIEMHEPKNFELFFSLNRGRFNDELVKLAVSAGTQLMSGEEVVELIKEDGRVRGVKTKKDEIRSNLVIDARGIESNYRSFKEVDSCIEYLVEGVDLDREYIHYSIGDKFEFFYIVPKGDKFAITLFSSNPTEEQMNLFIKENLPEAEVIEKYSSQIPFGSDGTIKDGMMLVGDSAGCASPFSRFGVLCAIDSGILAGETIVEAYEENDFSSDLLSRYEKRWYKLHGARNDIEYDVRKFLEKNLSREDVNSLFHILKDEDGFFTDAFFKKLVGSRRSKLRRTLFEKFKRYDCSIWDLFVR